MSALATLPRLAIFAVTGATALSVAALATPAPAHAEGDWVMGPIALVSGSTFQVTGSGGTTQVAFTDSTTISEAVPASLSEVTVGSCLKAGAAPESTPADNGAITAKWVMVGPAVDGKCPQRPGATPPPAAPAQHRFVRGVVGSVAGDTITVTRQDNSTATVTVTDDTHYRKRAPADAQAIAQGKCVAARGPKDGNGVLQAARVTVWTATDGNCPQPTG